MPDRSRVARRNYGINAATKGPSIRLVCGGRLDCRQGRSGRHRPCQGATYAGDHRALYRGRAGRSASRVASALPSVVPKAAGPFTTAPGHSVVAKEATYETPKNQHFGDMLNAITHALPFQVPEPTRSTESRPAGLGQRSGLTESAHNATFGGPGRRHHPPRLPMDLGWGRGGAHCTLGRPEQLRSLVPKAVTPFLELTHKAANNPPNQAFVALASLRASTGTLRNRRRPMRSLPQGGATE